MSKDIIYHGSAYESKNIQPGFNISKKLINWDDTEDNTYLYATKDKTEAIILGFFSAIEKRYGGVGFHHKGKDLTIDIEGDDPKLNPFNIYLYECELTKDWEIVNNKVNTLQDEYKTKGIITPIKCTKINILNWLKENHYKTTFNLL